MGGGERRRGRLGRDRQAEFVQQLSSRPVPNAKNSIERTGHDKPSARTGRGCGNVIGGTAELPDLAPVLADQFHLRIAGGYKQFATH